MYLVLTAMLLSAPKPHIVRDDDEPKRPTWADSCHDVNDMEHNPICMVRKA